MAKQQKRQSSTPRRVHRRTESKSEALARGLISEQWQGSISEIVASKPTQHFGEVKIEVNPSGSVAVVTARSSLPMADLDSARAWLNNLS
jgi:hypothetical protein